MKCPNCGNDIDVRRDSAQRVCPICGQALPTREKRTVSHVVISVIIWAACAVIFALLFYKVYYWFWEYRLERLYVRGSYAPTISEVSLSDGRVGHALIYYGKDGDQIFVPELGYSTMITGGTARFEFADSEWFQGMDVSEIDGADIVFSPVLISQTGEMTQLPAHETYISVPESPFRVTSPKENGLTVFTSTYTISGWVVPGSVVSINGEDITSYVDRAGNMSLDVRVRPINNNLYTFLVKTPNHRETRYDVTIYRQKLSIEVELDDNVSNRSSNATMVISGTTEPGCTISVDTVHLTDSLSFDMSTGEFSFIAKFENIGSNVVRFRASKPGVTDAVVSFSVYYVPSRAQYINTAWKMDYSQLRLLYEQWHGKKFRCDGKLIARFTEDDLEYLVMDVGTDAQQLILLNNDSTLTDLAVGRSYTVYADVAGRHMYNASYYPLLIARYMDIQTGS